MPTMMKAAVFVEKNRIEVVDKPIPDVGPNDALIRITTTTICGTDVHILKGEYPVAKGLTIGHEPVGVIEKLGSAVQGYTEGQRVIAGAICPNFNSYAAQDGAASQDGSYLIPQGLCGCHGYKPTAGWRFGNLIDGTQAEYVLVPDAQGNLAPIPDGLTDEQVLMCPDIMSTGFKGAENAGIRIGDTVVVFAQGPIGLCATAHARQLCRAQDISRIGFGIVQRVYNGVSKPLVQLVRLVTGMCNFNAHAEWHMNWTMSG
jgi:threonine dehydrogenase-like Zn-dependent dehydrogenase